MRRRLDRILADGYLAGLADLPTDEVRRMRDDCEEEEAGVSFARRVLQGRLDILRAEALRRRDEGGQDVRDLLEALPTILGDPRAWQRLRPRVPRFLVPPSARYHRREVERLAEEQALSGLAIRPTGELADLADEMADKERELSVLRRRLLDRMDALQDELAARYRRGHADVTELLSRGA